MEHILKNYSSGHTHPVVSLIIVVCLWIGLWGVIDTLVQTVVKNHVGYTIAVYGAMSLFFLLLVTLNPTLIDPEYIP